MSFFRQIWVVVLVFLWVGCVPFRAESPEGFAPYKGRRPYRAVSADGVMYRVRYEKNKPKAELAFWKEALKSRMIDAGYRFQAESDLEVSGHPGYLLELAAPLGTQDYTYLNAIFVHGRKLVIVEASGEVSQFQKHRASLLDAINHLEL